MIESLSDFRQRVLPLYLVMWKGELALKRILALGVVIIFCLGIIGCEKTKEEDNLAEPETFVAIQEDEIVKTRSENITDKN